MDEQRPWHRMFATSWSDYFHGTPVAQESEKDLSMKKQLLDVLLRRTGSGALGRPLPDGFEDLANYNLITFKSHQERMSVWTLLELIGHYVNVRKQAGPSMDEDDLLPEEEFRLYAVTVRFPQLLRRELDELGMPLHLIGEGVYEVRALTCRIRIVVVNQLPHTENNAMLLVFSTRPDSVDYGVRHYQIRSSETSTLLLQLLRRHQEEDKNMADALKELYRETVDKLLKELPLEKRLEGLTPEQRTQGLTPQQRLQGLTPEQRRELLKELERNGGSAQES